ncbi:hypothetical protein SAMN05444398_12137 [Roseovarius pacificus]|uniref:Uncharacterized protein n=1 Tax=Roseovarius pacificus TaxID=337701 RepID=A0A1M7JP63_9RHOB|nr:hypothetical protein SAMN05444398_12137 [Roseovarius pacificus]
MEHDHYRQFSARLTRSSRIEGVEKVWGELAIQSRLISKLFPLVPSIQTGTIGHRVTNVSQMGGELNVWKMR